MEKHVTRNVFSEQLFEYRCAAKKRLILSLSITSVVMVVEFISGFLTNSIALISDAGHMFTHCFVIGISLAAMGIATRPPCHHRTFGLYRGEILAAFINGLVLLLVAGVIIYEAVLRIIQPREVLGIQMLAIALLGLAVNLASIFILRGGHKSDLNVRSVFYHMVGDAASSVGVVIAAVIISRTGWNIVDPLVSLGISAIIIYWACGILKVSSTVLLEMAPTGLNVDIINHDLKANFPEIEELHNVHIWTITPDMIVFSAHMKLYNTSSLPADQEKVIVSRINKYLFDKYSIVESTIQIAGDESEVCNIPPVCD
jgi:cobalt-zinc-cadmium efflux system protein